jgi:hypothetical protein
MQLKSGNMYSKLVASKREKQVDYLKKNLECHQNARKCIEEYKKEQKLVSDMDLPPLMQQQMQISDDMISLLPSKIDKVHYMK